MQLILSSSSPARKTLLQRLMLPFSCIAPNVDESIKQGESAEGLVERLALAKARVGSQQFPEGLIIGCDQVGVLNGKILNKPSDEQHAFRQLKQMSGATVTFFTGLCLLNAANDQFILATLPYRVKFRHLTETLIRNYLAKEQPFHCAGSFQVEGLGISLVQALEGEDYTALIGLPLIKLTSMLESFKAGPLQN